MGNGCEDGIIDRLLVLAKAHPHYGYWKLYYLLRDEGYIVNHKRVYRLYKMYIRPQKHGVNMKATPIRGKK